MNNLREILILLLLTPFINIYAQDSSWERLNQEFLRLHPNTESYEITQKISEEYNKEMERLAERLSSSEQSRISKNDISDSAKSFIAYAKSDCNFRARMNSSTGQNPGSIANECFIYRVRQEIDFVKSMSSWKSSTKDAKAILRPSFCN